MSNRTQILGGTVLALSLAASVAFAAAAQDFVKKAGTAGLYEVRAAELARDKAQDKDVREFANTMMDDHRKANDELRALAKKRSWTMPTELDAKSKEQIDRLSKMQGAEFEREYAKQQVQAHEQAVALFKDESQSGADAELKAWAAQKLPTLQHHLKEAQALEGGEGAMRNGSTPGGRPRSPGSTAPEDRL